MGSSVLVSVLKSAAKEAAEAAASYTELLVSGPFTNPFSGEPKATQIPSLVPRLRSGDCLKILCLNLPESAETISAAMALTKAMQDVAARALAMDEPRLASVQDASIALDKIIKYDSNTVHSASLVKAVYGETAPFGTMWKPMAAAVQALVHAEEYSGIARLIDAVRGVNDDNDLSCAINSVTRLVVQKMLSEAEQDEARSNELGQLAYTLAGLDNQVMGSELTMTYDDYIDYETKHHRNSQSQSSGAAMQMR